MAKDSKRGDRSIILRVEGRWVEGAVLPALTVERCVDDVRCRILRIDAGAESMSIHVAAPERDALLTALAEEKP